MFISIEELIKLEKNKEDIIIIETTMTEGRDSFTEEEVYESGHIKDALFINGKDIYPKSKDELKSFYESYGISDDSIVILYDDVNLGGPSRSYIDLKNLGIDQVYIMNGNSKSYKEAGGQLEKDPNKAKNNGKIKNQVKLYIEIVDHAYVKDRLDQNTVKIIDARRKIDYDQGHIPGAINISFENVRNEDNSIKDLDQIKENFDKFDKSDEIIVYCNFSFLGSLIALALKLSGYEPKLYAGSYKEWEKIY